MNRLISSWLSRSLCTRTHATWRSSMAHVSSSRPLFLAAMPSISDSARVGCSAQQQRRYSADAKGIVSFLLADIGEGITEVQVLQLFVKEGDTVKEFDKIAEVQSDKAAVEITSRYDGKITKMHAQPGSILKVGLPIFDIQTSAENAPASTVPPCQKTKTMPRSTGAPFPPAPLASSSEMLMSTTQTPPTPTPATAPTPVPTGPTRATPAVRYLAKTLGLSLDQVQGSGPDGRILKADLQKSAPETGPSPPLAKPTPTTSMLPNKVPLNVFQRSMVKSMQASLQIPHFGYSEEILLDALLALRTEIKSVLSKDSPQSEPMPPFTPMSLWMKAASMALSDFPILNASILADPDGTPHLHYHANHHIGFAMDSPQGLIVPVIKNVQSKTLLTLATDLATLIAKGKEGTLNKDDLSGGTFTLSNIGAIGSGVSAIPILLVPQVCIGALCKIQRKLVVASTPNESTENHAAWPGLMENESVRVASVMRVNWSADHRIVDGATMARFSARWKFLLENPQLLMPHLK